MRYTRVDLKKKKNEVLLFTGIITVIFVIAFFLGTTIFNFFLKGSVVSDGVANVSDVKGNSDTGATSANAVDTNFIILQCGVFSIKDNAQKVYNSLCSFGTPIIIEENGKFKIYFGIYENGGESKSIETLKNNGIDVSKITLKANVKDICDDEIVETCRAAIKILNKLNEKDVSSINIAELKSWINNLKGLSEKENNFNKFQELKQYIVALPDSLTKEKAVELETKIINVLKSISS